MGKRGLRVIELPLSFHERGVRAIIRQIHRATENAMCTNYDIVDFGTTFAFFFNFGYFPVTNYLRLKKQQGHMKSLKKRMLHFDQWQNLE